jgi:addiction module RelE/StbE family toxin
VFSLTTTKYFLRRAKKFFKKHPDLKLAFEELVEDLRRNPFQPHLEYHHLSGKLEGIQAVSLTHSYRVSLTIVVKEKEIILLDIGTHDEVYRKR